MSKLMRLLYVLVCLAGTVALRLCDDNLVVLAQSREQTQEQSEMRDLAGHQSHEIDRLYVDADKQETHIENTDRNLLLMNESLRTLVADLEKKEDLRSDAIQNTISRMIWVGTGVSGTLFLINFIGLLDPLKNLATRKVGPS
jgi:hypothetical protein